MVDDGLTIIVTELSVFLFNYNCGLDRVGGNNSKNFYKTCCTIDSINIDVNMYFES